MPAALATGITLQVHDQSGQPVPNVRVEPFVLTADNRELTWQLGNLPSFSSVFLVLGYQPLNMPLIGNCSMLVDPVLVAGPFVIGPIWSSLSLPVAVPPGLTGAELYSQAALFVNGVPDYGMLAVSNGLKLVVP